MSRPRLKVSVLCLTLALGASFSLAATPRKVSAPLRSSEIGAPWSLFAHLWGSLTSLRGQAGATADPNGRSGAQSTKDNGASLDPDGRSGAQSTTDNGASLDPSGK
jgi:hypothetical protein